MCLTEIIPPEILSALSDAPQAYLVGGAVRDYLLKIDKLKDFDFVVFTELKLTKIARKIAGKTNSSYVLLDWETDSHRIVNKSWQLDLVAPRGTTIEEDLKARDLTVNAIAFDLQESKLIDPLNGQEDLAQGLIRAVSLENLRADPLRMLRVFRCAAHLNSVKPSKIDEQTLDWIQKNAASIETIAPERISAELWGILKQPHSLRFLQQMWQIGLWESIFPEFTPLRKVPPNDFHHLPLPEHTFELVRQIEEVVPAKLPKACLKHLGKKRLGNVPVMAVLKMGCLLHDIAKPETWQIKDGKHTFYGHDKKGALTAERIGRRLHWPKLAIACLKDLVLHHLRPFSIAPLENEPTAKAERKFFRQVGEHFYPLLALAWADLLSIRGPRVTDEMIKTSEERLLLLYEHYVEMRRQESKLPPLLSGQSLLLAIREAELAPTKLIRELLNEVREKQLSGLLKNKKEAHSWFVEEGRRRSLEPA